MEMYEAGWTSDLGIIALRKWSLDERQVKGKVEENGGDAGGSNVVDADSGKSDGVGDEKDRGTGSKGGIIGVGGWIRYGKRVN